MPVRVSIVLWSTISGAILGLFIDATLIGVALLLSALPGVMSRLNHRWIATTASWLTSVIAASSRQKRGSAAA